MKKIEKLKWENCYIEFKNGITINTAIKDNLDLQEIINKNQEKRNYVTKFKLYTVIFETKNQAIRVIGDNKQNFIGYENILATPSKEITKRIEINQFD